MSAARLYNAEVLGLATALAAFPLTDDLPLRGAARSALCGSSLEIGLAVDAAGRIAGAGLKVHACAIGQAAAAIFAQAAIGRARAELVQTEARLREWLVSPDAPRPDWPGLETIAPARAYPARHGAIMLAWQAALEALP
ncbi:MAG: iron-sulfur cluster assembly scaffold protein [Sphingomonadales bacterium]|nr:iron-sulfur cluster assembly scaffold protein [Sphingomonadales bacterium]